MEERVLNGRYRLEDVLGEGGMAVVHRGHDLLLNRPVAIKILRPQYAADENFLRRFEREAQSAAGMSHPNIVNVYDVGTDSSLHYIVMEYIRGPSLKELIKRQGPFSVDGAIFVIGQVASALDYAHERGLVHRDVKPQNILVDRDGNAKVVDFGIAKGAGDVNLTEAGTGMGTVHYVSPEQAQGQPATSASDLYSTGVVLFEMLTKRLPFEADTPVAVAMQHVNTPPPPPSTFNGKIPHGVDAIVLKALAKNPTDRYESGARLAEALRRWDKPSVSRQASMVPVVAGSMAPRADRGAVTAVAPTVTAPARTRPRRQAQGVARQRSGSVRVPPPRQQARHRAGATTAHHAYKDDVGCVTWLIGSAILVGIIGLIVLAFRLGPGAFATEAPDDAVIVAAGEVLPTSTPTIERPSITPTSLTVAAPTLQPISTATATITPTPSAAVAVVGVPALTGMTLDDALTLVGDGWGVNVVEEPSDEVASGFIIWQDPGPGAQRHPGDIITVGVSQGPAMVAIPDLRGSEAAAAQAALESLGFSVETVEEENAEFAEGLVTGTDPIDAAPPGSTIILYISLGSGDVQTVIVPNVFGVHYDEAIVQLEATDLLVTDAVPATCDEIQADIAPEIDCASISDGAVVGGSLDWESEVPAGSEITITYFVAE